MKKLLILLILFFALISIAKPQASLKTYYYDGAISYGVQATLDSNVTLTSTPYFDWTLISANSTIYLTTAFVQNHFNFADGNDTVIIILKGMDGLGNQINIDTTGIIVSHLVQTATQITLTPTSYFPMIAFAVQQKHVKAAPNGNKGILYATLTVKQNTIVNPQKQYFW